MQPRKNNGVVMCHGCFDVLHVAHHWHLKEARTYGELLVVSITSARYVNKGKGFPVFTDAERMEQLMDLRFVDDVRVCDAPYAYPSLVYYRPDVYCKGADYAAASGGVNALDKSFCDLIGTRIIYTRAEKKYGSTNIARRLCESW